MTQMGLAGLTTRSELSSIRKLVSQARKRMKYLLDNELAPLTFSWGFIEGPLSKVADYWVPWTKGIHGSVETEVLMATLPTALRKLEPLITPHSRELLLSTRSQWVAYFDNGKHGGDPQSRVGHVCRALKCRGVAVTCVPHTLKSRKGMRRASTVACNSYCSHRKHGSTSTTNGPSPRRTMAGDGFSMQMVHPSRSRSLSGTKQNA